jgi:hypothetical protein
VISLKPMPEVGDQQRGTRPSCKRACMPYGGRPLRDTLTESGPRSAVTPWLSAPSAHRRTGRVSLGLGRSAALSRLGFRSRGTRSADQPSLGFTAVYLVWYGYVRGWYLKLSAATTVAPVPPGAAVFLCVLR